MKRIEFIAPVEAMRGNLSGEQKLKYARNDNPAWDAPVGQVNYARNYQPRFIGAKKTANGMTYFTTKTKSANNNSAAARLAMAAMGAACAYYNAYRAALQTGDEGALLLQSCCNKYKAGRTERAYLMPIFVSMFKNKTATKRVGIPGITVCYVENPFISSADGNVRFVLSVTIQEKFWTTLADDPIQFDVQGLIGIAHNGDTWDQLINSDYNVLGFSKTSGQTPYRVKLGDMWLQYADTAEPGYEWIYVSVSDDVYSTFPPSTDSYRLTEVAPA